MPWLLNNNSSNAYSITQLAGLEFELCAGLKEDNILLRGILNKGIASTRLSFDSIVTRDTLAAGGWKNVLNQIPPYMLVKSVNKMNDLAQNISSRQAEEEAPAAPTTKICPYCKSEISIDATRCPHCTSQLDDKE